MKMIDKLIQKVFDKHKHKLDASIYLDESPAGKLMKMLSKKGGKIATPNAKGCIKDARR